MHADVESAITCSIEYNIYACMGIETTKNFPLNCLAVCVVNPMITMI